MGVSVSTEVLSGSGIDTGTTETAQRMVHVGQQGYTEYESVTLMMVENCLATREQVGESAIHAIRRPDR